MIFLLCLMSFLLIGCGNSNTISEDVEAVLTATMNTPNEALFDPEMLYNSDMSDEEKAQVLAIQEEINKNWESLLGQYFSPGSFDQFLNSYIRTRFFADDPLPSSITSVTLVSKDDTQEVVDVQVLEGEETLDLTVTFRRNPDGLLYRVEMEEKN